MLTIIGGIIGLFVGGPFGMLLGAGLGYFAGQFLARAVVGQLQVASDDLIESIFSVMGAICKADNVVTRDEIDSVEHMFDMLRLNDAQRQRAKQAFSSGKQPGFDLDGAVDRFLALSRGRAPLIQLYLQLQSIAVAADGKFHPAEHQLLVRIAKRLGLSEADVAQLESLIRAATSGAGPSAAPTKDRLADAYIALGVTEGATDAEVKRAYRKLISQNHPDKLAARGLPDSMRAVAEERSRELNAAYDLIKSSRGFV